MSLQRLELLFGWLAVVLGGAVLAFTYYGNFIAADSIQRDVLVFRSVLGVLALGVSLDGLFGWLVGRLLLVLATLALLVITAISFISFLYPPAFLALGAAILAFARPHLGHALQRR